MSWRREESVSRIDANMASMHARGFPGNERFADHRVVLRGSKQQLLHRNVKGLRGGLVCKARRFVYHSTLGSRVIKKKKRPLVGTSGARTVVEPSCWKYFVEMCCGSETGSYLRLIDVCTTQL